VLLFDPSGDVLLMRFAIPQAGGEDFVFWCAPGGEIEGDESESAAAQREVREELGLDLAMEGPVRVDRNEFVVRGEMCDNTDYYFLAHCERDAPRLIGLTAEEIAIMQEIRWWTLDEVEASSEKIFPAGLTGWVRALSKRCD
jgi:ADP-ribose pyrophosphatase YjhB (NUDIX family)